jgi:hypothetical protein
MPSRQTSRPPGRRTGSRRPRAVDDRRRPEPRAYIGGNVEQFPGRIDKLEGTLEFALTDFTFQAGRTGSLTIPLRRRLASRIRHSCQPSSRGHLPEIHRRPGPGQRKQQHAMLRGQRVRSAEGEVFAGCPNVSARSRRAPLTRDRTAARCERRRAPFLRRQRRESCSMPLQQAA